MRDNETTLHDIEMALGNILGQLKFLTDVLEKIHTNMPKEFETHDVNVVNTPLEITGSVSTYKGEY